MPDTLKVAHVTWEFPSPSETFIVNEVEGLTRLGCPAKVIALRPPPGGARRVLAAARTMIVRPVTTAWLAVGCLMKGVPLRMLDALVDLQRRLEAESRDLVHAQFGYVGYLCVPVLAWFRSLPLVVSFRGQDASALPLKHPGLYEHLFRRGHAFLARSEAMKRDLVALGCPIEKTHVHHSGIDLNQFPFRERRAPPASEPTRILIVGRLVEKKGIPDAVAAFAEARRRYPNIQLRIIGDGPMREPILREISARDLGDSAVLLGGRSHDEVAEEMNRAHLFLLPSRTASDGDKEGIPNAIMEAMASGLPVLSTFHAGIPECVENEVSGLLVDEGDTAALADRLSRLLDHPDRWPDMGRAGRAKIEAEFNREVQAKRLISVYREIVGRNARDA